MLVYIEMLNHPQVPCQTFPSMSYIFTHIYMYTYLDDCMRVFRLMPSLPPNLVVFGLRKLLLTHAATHKYLSSF